MLKKNEQGFLVMGADNNKKDTEPERRIAERREMLDRRVTARFSDVLGRRSGIERRLPIRDHFLPMR